MSRVWVLVYCLQVITLLVDICILNYEIVCNCMINHFSALAYPSVFVCFVWCDFLFLRWSSIYWCEHMWEILVVNRGMVTPLRSPPRLDSAYWAFLFGLWPMYCLLILVWSLLDFVPCLVLTSWCASEFPFMNSWISLRSDSINWIFTHNIILCDLSFK